MVRAAVRGAVTPSPFRVGIVAVVLLCSLAATHEAPAQPQPTAPCYATNSHPTRVSVAREGADTRPVEPCLSASSAVPSVAPRFTPTDMFDAVAPGAPRSALLAAVNPDGQGGGSPRSFAVTISDEFALRDAELTGVEFNSTSSLGDVDNDGDLDLLITGRDQDFNQTATLYLNDGEGAFTDAHAGLAGVVGGSSSLGDVDADGDLDLLIAGTNEDFDPSATLYVNDGTGTFTDANANLEGVSASSSAVGDVDNDGDLDLLITGGNSANEVTASLYLNHGAGTFAQTTAGLDGVANGASSFADVDGDGNLDLFVTGYDANGVPTAQLYFGDGQGGFSPSSTGLTGVGEGSTAFGDVDSDDDLDLIITGAADASAPTSVLYLNDGVGNFSAANASLTGVFLGSSSLFSDIDRDGDLDLFISGSDGTQARALWYLNDGTGRFTAAETALQSTYSGSATSGDADGDGDGDLILTGTDDSGNASATLYENLSIQAAPEATFTATVNGAGVVSFGSTGIAVDFGSGTTPGNVTVTRFDDPPVGTDGINEATVSTYRFVVAADAGLNIGENTAVRFDATVLPGIDNAGAITIYSRPGIGTGVFTALPTSVDGSDIVATANGFSEFVLASDDTDNPLPVELTAFEATTAGESVTLTWQTASETQNAGFRVQRRVGDSPSGEDGTWTEVGFAAGAGTTAEPTAYRFTDADLPYEAETLTYRLEQIDTDGAATLSPTVEVVLDAPDRLALHSVFPNPMRHQATLRYEVPQAGPVDLAVYNALGQHVMTLAQGEQPAGREEVSFAADGLSSGLYFIRLHAEGQVLTRKITVVR